LERENSDLRIKLRYHARNRRAQFSTSTKQQTKTKRQKEKSMKIRDISLVAFGAIAAVSVMLAASVIFYTPRSQAQASSAAPAPGGVSMIVSPGNIAGAGAQGGTIALQDSVNRLVTVVPYSFYMGSVSGNVPVLEIGAKSTVSY
jgi:hypothetical protein